MLAVGLAAESLLRNVSLRYSYGLYTREYDELQGRFPRAVLPATSNLGLLIGCDLGLVVEEEGVTESAFDQDPNHGLVSLIYPVDGAVGGGGNSFSDGSCARVDG